MLQDIHAVPRASRAGGAGPVALRTPLAHAAPVTVRRGPATRRLVYALPREAIPGGTVGPADAVVLRRIFGAERPAANHRAGDYIQATRRGDRLIRAGVGRVHEHL